MARKGSATPPEQVTANAQDIGYVLGKMEMIEKKFDEHRIQTEKKDNEILLRLENLTKVMGFWRHSLWLIKAILASIPLLLAANYTDLIQLWKGY